MRQKKYVIRTISITQQGEVENFFIPVPNNAKKLVAVGVVANNFLQNYVYYGVGLIGGNNNAFVQTLAKKKIPSTQSDNFTVNAALNQYIYYATPVRLGEKLFFNNGFGGGFEDPIIVNVTDASSGYTEPYYLYRSINDFLALTTIQVQ